MLGVNHSRLVKLFSTRITANYRYTHKNKWFFFSFCPTQPKSRMSLAGFYCATAIVLSLVGAIYCQVCDLPTEAKVETLLVAKIKDASSEGSLQVSINETYWYNFTCLAVRQLDKYEYASVQINYRYMVGMDASSATDALSQFEIMCVSANSWIESSGMLANLTSPIESTEYCASCLSDDSESLPANFDYIHNCYRE